MTESIGGLLVPGRNDPRRLTLLGDRQMGKTHLLLDLAVQHAEEGRGVLYTCGTIPLAGHTFDRCLNDHARFGWPGSKVEKASPGFKDIHFEGGGFVKFEWASGWKRFEGRVDVHILDDVQDSPRAEAQWIIRAVLS